MKTDAKVKAIANFNPITPDINTNPSGLINGEEVKNAIIGLHGSVVVSIPIITAVVPQAHKGVNAPKITLANIEIFFLLTSNVLNLSELTYVFMKTAKTIAISRIFQLCCNDVPSSPNVSKNSSFININTPIIKMPP